MASSKDFIEHVKERVKLIVTDPSRDELMDKIGIDRMKDSYFMKGETSPQERYAFVSAAFGSDPEHAQRLYDYSSKHWFGYATPILSYGRNKRSLPISCFGTYIPDTAEGLIETWAETNRMSMMGGGVGLYFGIRGQDEKSVGLIPHAKTYDASVLAYKQGTTRRGSYALYMDIDHPEVVEFLKMRKVSGDPNRKCLNLHNAINISDAFMEIIERCMVDPKANDDWQLVDPITKEIKDTVSAKELWQEILELRAGAGRGEPYIFFSDTVNIAAPKAYKKHGLKVHHSNLCLVGDTIIEISTADNAAEKIRLDDFIVKYELGYYPHVTVKAHNGTTLVWSNVTNAAQTGTTKELYEIESGAGKIIRCTPDHKIYTKNRGFVAAKDLIETDELLEL